MLLITSPYVEGYRIHRYGPLVAAEAVIGTNIFRDYLAKVRDVVGGRSASFQMAFAEAREQIMQEIQLQAQKSDCNAIIGIDIDYGEVSGGGKTMLLVAVQGTAVYIEPE